MINNDMFGQMDGVIQPLANKKPQWKENLFLAMNFGRQKLSI